MNSLKDPIGGGQEKCLDPQLWHACAGALVRLPPVNSKVFYFPQGHAEIAYERVDFGNLQIPAMVLCRVLAIRYKADAESDEVFAEMKLTPLKQNELDYEEYHGDAGFVKNEKTSSFIKTLTQSDANSAGGFSLPRHCAETIFPRLDYNIDPPPVRNVLVKDVHEYIWKFRHIYRRTPRRHLLTTGWSNFVNKKMLVAGDSVVFMRAENGDVYVGIRRAKKGGIGSGHEYSEACNLIGGSSPAVRKGKVTAESVLEAATLAISGRPFEVVYYPRVNTSNFCVKASDVGAAMQVPWCSGMRFKMSFETEDSTRNSWFMGTVSSVNFLDPVRWPNSPWRILQVAWDDLDRLRNVKRVSPWLVQLVSRISPSPVPLYPPPMKKMRLPDSNSTSVPSFSSNHLRSGNTIDFNPDFVHMLCENIDTSDLHHLNRLPGFDRSDPPLRILPGGNTRRNRFNDDKGSRFLLMGRPAHPLKEDTDTESKNPHIVLFGKLIQPDQLKSGNQSSDTNLEKSPISSGGSNQNGVRQISTSEEGSCCSNDDWNNNDVRRLETEHCKVFMKFEDVGRTLDLSALRSYEDLARKLSDMFGIDGPDILNSVFYSDASGDIKYAGKEPFSEFLRTARLIRILLR